MTQIPGVPEGWRITKVTMPHDALKECMKADGEKGEPFAYEGVICMEFTPDKVVKCTCPVLDGVPVTGSSCPIHGFPPGGWDDL
jgi:hypothetical protein